MSVKNKTKLTRRNFFKSTSFGFLGAGILNRNSLVKLDQQGENENPKINEYRTLGRTGFKVSDIGSGAPFNGPILKTLLNAGVNYIDTAETYFNGRNETLIGETIKGIDRKSLFITTKIFPGQGFRSKEYVLDRCRKSLERLQTDYIDCYMIHGVPSSDSVGDKYFHEAIEQLKNEGRVRFCGASNHGDAWYGRPIESMEKILMTAVEDGRFDVLLLAYNFIQKEMGGRILKACSEKNIGTTIMKANPIFDHAQLEAWLAELEQEGQEITSWERGIVQGYKAAANKARTKLKDLNVNSSDELYKDIAIPFVLSNPDVNTVLIAFTNYDTVKYQLKFSGKTLTGSGEKEIESYESTLGQFYCRHACGICEEKCPDNIPVNKIMRYNHYFLTNKGEKFSMQKYSGLGGNNAAVCQNCNGYCESGCPYKVPIQGLLNFAHRNLSMT